MRIDAGRHHAGLSRQESPRRNHRPQARLALHHRPRSTPHMKKSAILAAAAVVAATLAGPAMAQEVIYNPGYCAQFYPNANCQNKGPGNPYTGSYQRQVYRATKSTGTKPTGIAGGKTAITAGMTIAASRPAMSRPAWSVAPSARPPPSPRPPSSARTTPAATVSFAFPAACSGARTAGCISASDARSYRVTEKAAGWPPFLPLTTWKRTRRFWPFADKSGIRAAEDRAHAAAYRRSSTASIRRFSSAVEQRFCKPKVGSSILSTGTNKRLSSNKNPEMPFSSPSVPAGVAGLPPPASPGCAPQQERILRHAFRLQSWRCQRERCHEQQDACGDDGKTETIHAEVTGGCSIRSPQNG